MLRNFPHLEDNGGTAGGDSDALRSTRAKAHGLLDGNFPPPGEDGLTRGKGGRPRFPDDQLENVAAGKTEEAMLGPDAYEDEEADELPDFLHLTRSAEDQALMYLAQTNRRGWSQSFRAYNQEHFIGSKYTKPDWHNRSKIFRPKTRSAVNKDMAAVAASLFNNIDAINCLPGDEGDPKQRGAAAIMEELINYRTDRSSGKASIPWFLVALGARQNSLLTGVCLSKQSWKLELRKLDEDEMSTEDDENGGKVDVRKERWVPDVDRPDCQLIPPENFVIDPAADWTNPAQSSAYIIIKWPMHLDEIYEKQNSPQNPWKKVSEEILLSSVESARLDPSAIRRARESGIDRFDETQTGNDFKIIWVYEVFMRWCGEDYTFFSVSDRAYLTDPKPVREVYPEQFGERPLTLGIGSLQAHRIFPMSPVESWQQYQVELNEIANLSLDTIKQNVMPVTKVVRGRNIDIDQVRRRSYGSTLVVQDEKDITFDRPPDLPQSIPVMTRELELEFDDLAGQFNGQTAENSNALSRTLGGLKLVSGSANAVQEFFIRLWIETWVAPTLAQVVRLEQYYESDPIVLGLCGNKAQLFQKHGISKVDDDLLEQDITIRVSVGLGAGDPQQRLMRFSSAVQIALPLLQGAKQFISGEYQLDVDAIMEEVFGAAGYRDGGMRFIKKGPPQQNPLQDLQQQKIKSEIDKNQATGKGSVLQGLAAVAKVNLGNKELEADTTNQLLDRTIEAHKMGFEHAHKHMDQHLAATDTGFTHGLGLREHHLKAADQQHEHTMGAADHALAANDQAHQHAMGENEQAMAGDQQQHDQNQDRTETAMASDQQKHQQGQDRTKTALASDQQSHQQAQDKAKLELEKKALAQQAAQAAQESGAGGASDQSASEPSQPSTQSADTSGASPAPQPPAPAAPAAPAGIGREVPLPGAAGLPAPAASPQGAAPPNQAILVAQLAQLIKGAQQIMAELQGPPPQQ